MRHAITRAQGVEEKALRERNRAIALEIYRSTWNKIKIAVMGPAPARDARLE